MKKQLRTNGAEKQLRTNGAEKQRGKNNRAKKTVRTNGPVAVTFYHGGIWRTLHCRLCINCYGTGETASGRTSTHKHSLAGPVTITMQRRQCIVLQVPPCFLSFFLLTMAYYLLPTNGGFYIVSVHLAFIFRQ
jgi:hypothetical protein